MFIYIFFFTHFMRNRCTDLMLFYCPLCITLRILFDSIFTLKIYDEWITNLPTASSYPSPWSNYLSSIVPVSFIGYIASFTSTVPVCSTNSPSPSDVLLIVKWWFSFSSCYLPLSFRYYSIAPQFLYRIWHMYSFYRDYDYIIDLLF